MSEQAEVRIHVNEAINHLWSEVRFGPWHLADARVEGEYIIATLARELSQGISTPPTIEDAIIVTKSFGDVDRGPEAGIRVVVKYDGQGEPGELGDAVWQFFTTNYEDPFQEWRLVATDKDTITVDLYTFWGDGHPSITPEGQS
jgi:hypothetical protein